MTFVFLQLACTFPLSIKSLCSCSFLKYQCLFGVLIGVEHLPPPFFARFLEVRFEWGREGRTISVQKADFIHDFKLSTNGNEGFCLLRCMSCNQLKVNRYFGVIFRLHLQFSVEKYWNQISCAKQVTSKDMIHRTVACLPTHFAALYSRRYNFSLLSWQVTVEPFPQPHREVVMHTPLSMHVVPSVTLQKVKSKYHYTLQFKFQIPASTNPDKAFQVMHLGTEQWLLLLGYCKWLFRFLDSFRCTNPQLNWRNVWMGHPHQKLMKVVAVVVNH